MGYRNANPSKIGLYKLTVLIIFLNGYDHYCDLFRRDYLAKRAAQAGHTDAVDKAIARTMEYLWVNDEYRIANPSIKPDTVRRKLREFRAHLRDYVIEELWKESGLENYYHFLYPWARGSR